MSDARLPPAPALAEALRPARLGRPDGAAGLRAALREDVALVLVQPFRGMRDEAAAAIRSVIGVSPPDGAEVATTPDGFAAWAGPEGWLVGGRDGADIPGRLGAALGASAAVVDQSDGRVVLSLEGPAARAVLAKGIETDLDPAVFPAGRTAITKLAHLTVQVWALDERPRFALIVPRSAAGDIWHWLVESALEYGLEIAPNG